MSRSISQNAVKYRCTHKRRTFSKRTESNVISSDATVARSPSHLSKDESPVSLLTHCVLLLLDSAPSPSLNFDTNPICSDPTSGSMSHRVRRSFLVFPLAVSKLGRSRCTDTPPYMNFLKCVSNESHSSSSSRDNPVRNGKGSSDEAAIYPLHHSPK
jgi:hypothetical protein